MKKLLIVILSIIACLCLAVGFVGCGGNGNEDKGSIDGRYTEANEESFNTATEKLGAIISGDKAPVNTEAEKIGGTLNSNGEIKLTVGGKSVVFTASEKLSALVDKSKIGEEAAVWSSIIDATQLKLESKLGIKVDDGFGNALYDMIAFLADDEDEIEESVKDYISILDKSNINIDANAYLKDANLYVNAKASGFTKELKDLVSKEAKFDLGDLEKGYKYSFDKDGIYSLFDELEEVLEDFLPSFGKNGYDSEVAIASNTAYTSETSSDFPISYAELNMYLSMVDMKLYTEISSDGAVKIKLATSTTTKDKVLSLIKGYLGKGKNGTLLGIISDLKIDKLDAEIYVAFDKDGYLYQVAGNIDVAVSTKINDKTVSLAVNGKLNGALAVPQIDFPSFNGYENPFAQNELK